MAFAPMIAQEISIYNIFMCTARPGSSVFFPGSSVLRHAWVAQFFIAVPSTRFINYNFLAPFSISCTGDIAHVYDYRVSEVFDVMKMRCEMFEKKVEVEAKDKLKITGDLTEQPKSGNAAEIAGVAGPVTTVLACLGCGIAVACRVSLPWEWDHSLEQL